MKTLPVLALLSGLVVFLPTESVTGTDREITLLDPVEDTFIASDVADLNMGGTPTLNLGAFGKNGNRKGRLHPLLPGTMRGVRTLGLKKQFPSSRWYSLSHEAGGGGQYGSVLE